MHQFLMGTYHLNSMALQMQ